MRFIRPHRKTGTGNSRIPCGEARALISAVVDDEANDLERAATERHVRTCSGCRHFLRSLRRSQAEVRGSVGRAVWASSADRRLDVGRSRTLNAVMAELASTADGSAKRPQSAGSETGTGAGWLGGLSRQDWAATVLRAFAGRRLAAPAALACTVIVFLALWPTGPTVPVENGTLALPQVELAQNLDPSYVPYLEQDLNRGRIVVAGTADEKLLFFESPMSFHEQYHFTPEEL